VSKKEPHKDWCPKKIKNPLELFFGKPSPTPRGK